MVYDFAGSNLTDSSALAGCIEDEEEKDLILGAGIIVIALAMLLVMQLTRREEGNQIRVTLDGKIYGTYSLSKDQTIEVKDGDFITGSGSKTERRIWKRQTARMDTVKSRERSAGVHRQSSICHIKLVVEFWKMRMTRALELNPEDVAPDTIAKMIKEKTGE